MITLAVLDFNDRRVCKIFGGSSHDSVVNKIEQNYEGSIRLSPFKEEMLKHYENHYNSSPALKQICRIIGEDFDSIAEQIKA
jgi:hypothetical protein